MKLHSIYISSLIISLSACSPSGQEDAAKRANQLKEYNEKIEYNKTKITELARTSSAILVEPFSKKWALSHTFKLQESFENKKILFKAKLLDITKSNGRYKVILGNTYSSSTIFLLTASNDIVKALSKSPSKNIVAIATVQHINSLSNYTIESSNDDHITKAINREIFGKSYFIKGNLDSFTDGEKTP